MCSHILAGGCLNKPDSKDADKWLFQRNENGENVVRIIVYLVRRQELLRGKWGILKFLSSTNYNAWLFGSNQELIFKLIDLTSSIFYSAQIQHLLIIQNFHRGRLRIGKEYIVIIMLELNGMILRSRSLLKPSPEQKMICAFQFV